jgi:hypothetical protein
MNFARIAKNDTAMERSIAPAARPAEIVVKNFCSFITSFPKKNIVKVMRIQNII